MQSLGWREGCKWHSCVLCKSVAFAWKELLVFSVLPPAQTHGIRRRRRRLIQHNVSPRVLWFYHQMFCSRLLPLILGTKAGCTCRILRGLSTHGLTYAWLDKSTWVIHKMNRYPFNGINDPSSVMKCILGLVTLIWHPLEDLFTSVSHTTESHTPNSWYCRLQRETEVSQYVGHHRAH